MFFCNQLFIEIATQRFLLRDEPTNTLRDNRKDFYGRDQCQYSFPVLTLQIYQACFQILLCSVFFLVLEINSINRK